jgi:X-X-X-Leu-X-X-Gly heptad repeat protein
VKAALDYISTQLSSADMSGLSSLSSLPSSLTQIADGLDGVALGIGGIAAADAQLAAIILGDGTATNPGLPNGSEVSDAQIAALGALIAQQAATDAPGAAANQATLTALASAYKVGVGVRTAYDTIQASLPPGVTLASLQAAIAGDGTAANPGISASLRAIASGIETGLAGFDPSSLMQLSTGLTQLASTYDTFNSGLSTYTAGVGQLSSAYGQLSTGTSTLASGASTLSSGLTTFSSGMSDLQSQTAKMPQQVQDELDSFMAQYSPSDFTPVSFLSSQNANTTSVQFVLQTAAISLPAEPEAADEAEPEESFLDRLLALFGI